MKCKTKYMVICRLVDCENDFGLFPLCSDERGSRDEVRVFDTVTEARKAMKADYETFSESYDADMSVDGKDHCKRKVGKDTIEIKVPVWDGENERDSWIVAKWAVVGL